MKKILFLFAWSSLLLAGCKKNENASPKTKAELIVRTWEVQSATVTLGGIPSVSAYTKGASQNGIDMSKLRLQFRSNGELVQTGLDGVPQNYTWKLLNNDTRWAVINGQTTDEWDISTLTEQNFDYNRQIAGNSTNPSDLIWLSILKSYGAPTANGVKLEVRMIPAP